jgi:cysteine/O-acetylserine efflux protein
MGSDLYAALTFILVTTFSPGPNTLSSAAMGMIHGYRRSLPYRAGIGTGFFVMMLLCAHISELVLQRFSALQPYLSVIGAAYIVYLAFMTLRADLRITGSDQMPLRFTHGMVLQLVNVKVIIYGVMLYSTFFQDMSVPSVRAYGTAAGLALCSFSAISLWAAFGAVINRHMHHRKLRVLIRSILFCLLMAVALQLLPIS